MVTNKIEVYLAIMIKVFISISLFVPFYTGLINRQVALSLSNIIALYIIILCIIKGIDKKVKYSRKYVYILSITFIIYNIFMLYYNMKYNSMYWEQFNKIISVCFYISLLLNVNIDFVKKYGIVQFLVRCMIVTCLLSIVYYLAGRDALYFVNGDLQFTKSGGYSDKRLTWIFGHKSSYALIILFIATIIIKYRKLIKHYNFSLIVITITLILTNTKTALPLLLALIIYDNLKNNKSKKNIFKYVKFNIFFVLIGVSVFIAYKSIISSRDITSLGSRVYIYNSAKEYLKVISTGIGKEFGKITFVTSTFPVDNFHNIFLNEMLVFGINVGVIYFILFVVIALFNMRNNGTRGIILWGGTFILFFMDYCLRTDILSLFLLLSFISGLKVKDVEKEDMIYGKNV